MGGIIMEFRPGVAETLAFCLIGVLVWAVIIRFAIKCWRANKKGESVSILTVSTSFLYTVLFVILLFLTLTLLTFILGRVWL
jgi:hypothetical protein